MRPIRLAHDPAYDKFGFAAGREARGILMASGQIGNTRCDLAAQITSSLDAVAEVLAAGGYTLQDLLHLRILVLDVDAFIAQWEVVREYFAPDEVPPNTLYQVARLANPYSLIEIEPTAVR